MVTYNHVDFIEEAVESVLSQQTDLQYEICLGEDGSDDGTRARCEELAQMHPERIRLFLRDRKDVIYKDGRATGIFNFIETLKACSGTFVFILEGDDKWLHPFKMEEQVRYLQAHPEVAAVFHPSAMINAKGEVLKDPVREFVKGYQPTMEELLSQGSIAPSASLCIRRSVFDSLPTWYTENPSDWKIEVMAMLRGKVVCLSDESWSAYRVHGGGLWTGMQLEKQLRYRLGMVSDLEAVSELITYRKSLATYKQLAFQKGVEARTFSRAQRWMYLMGFLFAAGASFRTLRYGTQSAIRILVGR
jgi:glycosyltransferase involved in cell wall biosynthesis